MAKLEDNASAFEVMNRIKPEDQAKILKAISTAYPAIKLAPEDLIRQNEEDKPEVYAPGDVINRMVARKGEAHEQGS